MRFEWTLRWLLYAFWKYETSKNAINLSSMCPWEVSFRYVPRLELRIFSGSCLSKYHDCFQHAKSYFLSSGERRHLKWTPPRLRADVESNVFCFLYLFRHTTLRQHPIKKFRKVVTGKTIPKSTVSANKASESLNARALSATQLTPSLFGRGKGFQTSPDLMRMDGSRDFGVSRCCIVSARTGVRGGSGWGGRRGGCTVSGTAAPSQGPTVHMRLN